MLFTLLFWNDAAQRAIRSFAQGTMTVFTGDVFNFWSADWKTAFGVGLGTAVYSLLMSIDRSGTSTSQPTTVVANNSTTAQSRLAKANNLAVNAPAEAP